VELQEKGAGTADTPIAAGGGRVPSLWRNRDYLLLWAGQTISTIGGGISDLAFPLLILAVTRSPAEAGIASGLRTLAYVCFSLPAGAFVDRWDRKRLMIVCDTMRALILGSIAFAAAIQRLTFAQICACAFVEGTFFVFFNIAEVAGLPQVVTASQVPAAMAQNSATVAIADLVSSPLAGLLFTVSRTLPFLADALSYVVSVVSLASIRTRFQAARGAAKRSLRDEIGEGLGFLLRHRVLGPMSVLNGVNNLFTSGSTLIIIVLLQSQHVSAQVIGLIFGLSGVGGIAGALIGPRVQRRFRYGPSLAAMMWAYTLLWLLLAALHAPAEVALLLVAASILGPLYNVVIISYRLAATPDALQGRVNSVARLLSNGFSPIGVTLIGVLLERVGPIPTILVCVAGRAVVASAVALHPAIRNAPPASHPATA
jgi:predicted MFS family arabinose efflux permease